MKNRILKIVSFSVIIFIVGFNLTKTKSVDSSDVVITKLSVYSTLGRAFYVQVRDDVAFVADLQTGLHIINVSDPGSPTLLSLYEMDNPHKIYLDEDIAYVTGWENGFEIINISDSEHPVQLSHFNGSVMNTFDIEGDCAFIDSFGLQILNISDPQNPSEIYHYYDSGNTSAVFVEENTAYLGTYIYGEFYGFTIVDVTNKTNPQKLGQYNTTDIVAGISVVGDLALVANWGVGLLIFNVSNPENPVLLSNYFDGGASENAYFVDGYAFVADYNNGIEILNIKDPENPVEVGQFYDGGGAYGIAVQNNIAFVADDNQGLEILEITGLFPTKVSNGYGVFSALIVIHIFILFKLIKRKKR